MATEHATTAARMTTADATSMEPLLSDAEVDQLYETHGKPLDTEHRGWILAVSRDGQTILGEDVHQVAQEAVERFGSGTGTFLFRIGEISVDRFMW